MKVVTMVQWKDQRLVGKMGSSMVGLLVVLTAAPRVE